LYVVSVDDNKNRVVIERVLPGFISLETLSLAKKYGIKYIVVWQKTSSAAEAKKYTIEECYALAKTNGQEVHS